MSLHSTIASVRTRRMLTWFVPVVGLTLYLILVPPVPDFAAQATRAAVFRQLGSATWWPGWYGGVELPTYSVIAPALMATLGVARTGVIAAAISIWAAHQMLRDSVRPRAASVVFAATVLFNLFGGRITFLVGLAAATLAVLALVRRHPWLAAIATVVSVLGSPLAGLFTGIVAAAVLLTDRTRRREALFVGVATALSLGALAIWFHNPGVMASPPLQMLLALIGIALVAVACRQPTIRAGAVIVAVGLVICMVVPNSVGLNLTRMVWLLAAPLIVGYGHRPDRHVVALTGLALLAPSTHRRELAAGRGRLPVGLRVLLHPPARPAPRPDEHPRRLHRPEGRGGRPPDQGRSPLRRRVDAGRPGLGAPGRRHRQPDLLQGRRPRRDVLPAVARPVSRWPTSPSPTPSSTSRRSTRRS